MPFACCETRAHRQPKVPSKYLLDALSPVLATLGYTMAHQALSFKDEVRKAAIFHWSARGHGSRVSDFRLFMDDRHLRALLIKRNQALWI